MRILRWSFGWIELQMKRVILSSARYSTLIMCSAAIVGSFVTLTLPEKWPTESVKIIYWQQWNKKTNSAVGFDHNSWHVLLIGFVLGDELGSINLLNQAHELGACLFGQNVEVLLYLQKLVDLLEKLFVYEKCMLFQSDHFWVISSCTCTSILLQSFVSSNSTCPSKTLVAHLSTE